MPSRPAWPLHPSRTPAAGNARQRHRRVTFQRAFPSSPCGPRPSRRQTRRARGGESHQHPGPPDDGGRRWHTAATTAGVKPSWADRVPAPSGRGSMSRFSTAGRLSIPCCGFMKAHASRPRHRFIFIDADARVSPCVTGCALGQGRLIFRRRFRHRRVHTSAQHSPLGPVRSGCYAAFRSGGCDVVVTSETGWAAVALCPGVRVHGVREHHRGAGLPPLC